MTPEQTLPNEAKRRGTKRYVVLTCVVVAILALISAAGFYAEDLRLYFRLGGWNRGAATQITRQFIDHLQAGKTQEAVALVDPNAYETYSEEGKVAGLRHKDELGQGRYYVPFATMIPLGKVELGSVEISSSDEGGFVVPAKFADGTEGWFVVGRSEAGYRIIGVPQVPGRFHF